MHENDEYLVDDIIGMRVVVKEGKTIGTVKRVMHTGANDVYVVDTGEDEVLIPAIKEVVKIIDIKNKVMTIEPMEGLL